MKTLEKYTGGKIISNKNILYRVEGKVNDKIGLNKILKDISLKDTVVSDVEYNKKIQKLIKSGIMMYIKQIYIAGYPQVYAFMAPIICPNGEHPDIAGGISMNKMSAIQKTMGEAVERYHIFNFSKAILKMQKIDISSHMQQLGLTYFHPNQDIKNLKKGVLNILMKDGESIISGKKVSIPASFIYIPYKTHPGEDYIGEGTSTGAASHITKDDAIMNGIEEVIERHVNMKIRYNRLTPERIIKKTITDPEIQIMLGLLKKNGVEVDIFDTTLLNQFNIPSIMILSRYNAGGLHAIITSSCKSTLKDAITKALEEVLQGQTWAFLLNKYPDFKADKDYSNIKYFFHHILFYANKKNEKKLLFLLGDKEGVVYKNKVIKKTLSNYIKKIKSTKRDCYIVDLSHKKNKDYFVYKTFITNCYQLNRDNNAKFLGNIKNIKNINIIPHPFG